MRLLLDTHALLWWLSADKALTPLADATIRSPDNEVFVSAVSALEVAIKYRIGKLPQFGDLVAQFAEMMAQEGFKPLAVEILHGIEAGRLDFPHRDPFDRLLIAQALAEDLTLVSNERLFDQTGVVRLW